MGVLSSPLLLELVFGWDKDKRAMEIVICQICLHMWITYSLRPLMLKTIAITRPHMSSTWCSHPSNIIGNGPWMSPNACRPRHLHWPLQGTQKIHPPYLVHLNNDLKHFY